MPRLRRSGENVRVAVVGGGFIAKAHAAAFHALATYYPELPRVERLLLCDATQDLARKAAARLGFSEWAVGWEAAVGREDVDLVVIATPPDLHRDVSLAAVRAGKDVLCEKPLARNAAEAAEMCSGCPCRCPARHGLQPSSVAAPAPGAPADVRRRRRERLPRHRALLQGLRPQSEPPGELEAPGCARRRRRRDGRRIASDPRRRVARRGYRRRHRAHPHPHRGAAGGGGHTSGRGRGLRRFSRPLPLGRGGRFRALADRAGRPQPAGDRGTREPWVDRLRQRAHERAPVFLRGRSRRAARFPPDPRRPRHPPYAGLLPVAGLGIGFFKTILVQA